MYHTCIFCSADLKSNDVLERFPVGRSIAFDGEKGRLWAVCPRCARWNLAPIEERWEAIEDLERLFRHTRTRAQRANIGLAVLGDGTRLVRVGRALPGELAVWRYGEGLERRRARYRVLRALGLVGHGGVFTAGLLCDGILTDFIRHPVAAARLRLGTRTPLARLHPDETDDGEGAILSYTGMFGATLTRTDDGTLRLRLPGAREYWTDVPDGVPRIARRDMVLHGGVARRVLARGMAYVNGAGARPEDLRLAARRLAAAPSPGEYVDAMAAESARIGGLRHSPVDHLALEMALQEETETRALDGELAALMAMWRQAEEIAAIADHLPGDPPTG